MIIDSLNYIPSDAVILVSPCGHALGDSILFDTFRSFMTSVGHEYESSENPFEYTRLAETGDYSHIIHFQESNFVDPPESAINCSVAHECDLLAARGFYPQYNNYDPEFVAPFVAMEYAVVNLRNIKKAPLKNVDPITANFVLEYLAARFQKVIIVGNDEKLSIEIDRPNVIDFRKKLSLERIASLCRYASFYCGSDSGIGHLAAAAGCERLVVWGLWEKKYAPKTSFPCRYLMRGKDSIQDIIRTIKATLEDKI